MTYMTNDISDEVVEAALEAYREDFRDFDGTLQHEHGLRSAIRAAVLAERKRVIEECAQVVEKKAALCCGVAIYTGYGSPECCGDPLYMISNRDAAAAIRALGEK